MPINGLFDDSAWNPRGLVARGLTALPWKTTRGWFRQSGFTALEIRDSITAGRFSVNCAFWHFYSKFAINIPFLTELENFFNYLGLLKLMYNLTSEIEEIPILETFS